MRRIATWIADNEFWLVWVYSVPLLFASNLPSFVLYSAVLSLPLFWLARRIARESWSLPTPIDLPLLLLVVLGAVAVVVSYDRPTSLFRYAEWLGGIGLFYGILNGIVSASVPEARARLFSYGTWLVLALGTAMGLLGLLGLRFSAKFLPIPFIYDLLPRLDLSLLNSRGFTPNTVAGAIAPVIPLALGCALFLNGTRRVLLIGLIVLLLAALLLTQSRAALVALLIGCAVLVLHRKPLWLSLTALIVFILLGTASLLGISNPVTSLLLSDSQSTPGERLELWERAVLMLRDFPLTGIGLGMFEPTVLSLYPLFLNNPAAPVPHAHNLYLQMGVDFGIGGFVAFLGLVGASLGAGWQNIKRHAQTGQEWLAAALLASWIVFLLHGVLDAVFVSTKVAVIIWLVLGLMMALRYQGARSA